VVVVRALTILGRPITLCLVMLIRRWLRLTDHVMLLGETSFSFIRLGLIRLRSLLEPARFGQSVSRVEHLFENAAFDNGLVNKHD
jgi:hypothetical protein